MSESFDLTGAVDWGHIAALTSGEEVFVEVWSVDDPHGTPAATVKLVLSDG